MSAKFITIFCSLSALYAIVLSEDLLQVLYEESGYLDVTDTQGKSYKYFHYFFRKRSTSKSPVILWLTGMPGLSSSIALFRENGPFDIVNSEGLVLKWSYSGWDKLANILYLEEPLGTGFSYTNDSSNFRRNTNAVVDDLYNILQAFYRRYQDFRNNEFFIVGQSYAGKYGATLARRIYEEKQRGGRINLMGVAIGNGFIYPKIQFNSLAEYAEIERVIKIEDKAKIESARQKCEEKANLCDQFGGSDCESAYKLCQELLTSVRKILGALTICDITYRLPRAPGISKYDFSDVGHFMNHPAVKKGFGVEETQTFGLYNEYVFNAMKGDYMRSAMEAVNFLLQNNVNVLVYAGEYDLLCNYIGTKHWIRNLTWDGSEGFADAFADARYTTFKVDGEKAGHEILHKNLAYVQIDKAGHMASMDKPEVLFEVINVWILYTRRNVKGKSPERGLSSSDQVTN